MNCAHYNFTAYSPSVRAGPWGVSRGNRGSRRGRPRGSRHAFSRRPEPAPQDNAVAVAAGMLMFILISINELD